MIRAALALLLLIAVIAGFSGDARAHAGMAGHAAVVAELAVSGDAASATDASAIDEAALVPARTDHSPDHRPAGKCCMTAAGCGNAGSILVGAPLLPVPGRVAAADPAASPDTLRGLDLPVADRPPRPA